MIKRAAARKKTDRVPSRQGIVRLLKQQGPGDSEALAVQLGISAMAVRQHLYALRAQKLVTYQEEQHPIGRPAKIWGLTPAAESHFPARASLQNRLKKLISLRNEEGYMAEVQRQPDGSFLLIENHCPICAAATACTKLCDAELEVFQATLGESVVIERTEHILASVAVRSLDFLDRVKEQSGGAPPVDPLVFYLQTGFADHHWIRQLRHGKPPPTKRPAVRI